MKFTFSRLRKGIVLVEADSQYALCSMFLRPQEFYESPYEKIRGRYFTLEEYMDTYAEDKGKFSYYSDWCGFNIPSESFKKFVELFQYSLSAKENALVSAIRNLIPNFEGKFYIIGVCKYKENKETLEHETAHAFWYFDPEYQEKMKNLICKIPIHLYECAYESLISNGYDANFIGDEMQAYLATASRKKILNVLGWGKYPNVRIPRDIKKFFKAYKKHN